MRIAITVGAAALLVAAAASQTGAKPKPAARLLSAEQVVAARQAGMGLSAGVLGSYKGAVDAGGEVKPFAFSSRQLVKWANAIPSLFPAGTALPGSEAKPSIWANRADFDAKAAAFAAAATRLNDAAKAGDKEAFAAAFRDAGGACKGCHDLYRAEPAH
ncbi:MAG: cytochrome c [Alphaproteobacteria bacterium]|nr:cytochrome c [Alphaproteobacteria bacterium]MBV9372447.1 cytochrome c [Alphaproteobacteria bacterium]MBV9902122.1 cytochrome c [Alphaproteobacteria bacterium]